MHSDHPSEHHFVQGRSPFDSSKVGRTLQEAQKREEVYLTQVKLDGLDSDWLDTNTSYLNTNII